MGRCDLSQAREALLFRNLGRPGPSRYPTDTKGHFRVSNLQSKLEERGSSLGLGGENLVTQGHTGNRSWSWDDRPRQTAWLRCPHITTALAAERRQPSRGTRPGRLGFSGCWTHSGPGTGWQRMGCHHQRDLTISFAAPFTFLSLNASPQD